LDRASESLKVRLPPQDFNEFMRRLEEIKEMGYVKTHRLGPTGIGKTLEDILGIKENNVPGPNAAMLELKSARKGSQSMMTLVTKAPLPRGANSRLLQSYGYGVPKELHITLEKPGSWTKVKGNPAFKLDLKSDRIEIVSLDGVTLAFWSDKVLKEVFERKYPALAYVKADCKGNEQDEEFQYNEAWYLKDFNFDKIKELIRDGIIRVDVRIGRYRSGKLKGKPHDHGTGFRIFEDKFDLCFRERKRLI